MHAGLAPPSYVSRYNATAVLKENVHLELFCFFFNPLCFVFCFFFCKKNINIYCKLEPNNFCFNMENGTNKFNTIQ